MKERVEKEDLVALVTRELKEKRVNVEPLFPRVLVRVLPREQEKNGIILPDRKQNKPTHEGIVMKVYKPFWQRTITRATAWSLAASPEVHRDAEGEVVEFFQMCSVDVGDHILFPHVDYGITPVEPLDGGKGEWRLIEEGVIKAKLDYEDRVDLIEDIKKSTGLPLPEVYALMSTYDVTRRLQSPLTTSGA